MFFFWGLCERMERLEGLQSLLDEHAEVVSRVLSFLELADVLRLAMTCRRARRLAEDDAAVWARALRQQPALAPALRLPSCFLPRAAVRLALAELAALRAERAALAALLHPPPLAHLARDLFDFVRRSREPLHDPASNPFLLRDPSRKTKDASSQEDKAIARMLQASKTATTGSKVLVLGTDPALLSAIALQAVEYRPQGGAQPSASEISEQRVLLQCTVLRVVQGVAGEVVERLGRDAMRVARAALAAPPTEEGFASVAPTLQLLWNDEKMRDAATAQRERLHRTSLKRNLSTLMLVSAVDRLLSPERWPQVSSRTYVPTAADMALVSSGSQGGIRESLIVSKGFRVRLLDASALLLNCKRSKIVGMFEDIDLIVFAFDLGQRLPGRLPPDESFGTFEQLKLFEALATSRWFKKTLVMVLANVAGLEACVESVYADQDTAKHTKFLRSRLKVISRNPQQLSLANIRLVNPAQDSKLIDGIIRTISDLFLSRNVQKGF